MAHTACLLSYDCGSLAPNGSSRSESTSIVPGAGCTGSSESQPACLLFTLQSAGPRADSCRGRARLRLSSGNVDLP